MWVLTIKGGWTEHTTERQKAALKQATPKQVQELACNAELQVLSHGPGAEWRMSWMLALPAPCGWLGQRASPVPLLPISRTPMSPPPAPQWTPSPTPLLTLLPNVISRLPKWRSATSMERRDRGRTAWCCGERGRMSTITMCTMSVPCAGRQIHGHIKRK